MADMLYQVTTYGVGFNGPGQKFLGAAMTKVREKLREFAGPYHYQGSKQEHKRSEILDDLKDKASRGSVGDKWIVKGKNYDQPGIAFRIIKDEPEEHPRIRYARRFLGGTRYVFGAIPSLPLPSSSDCSGLVVRCVKETGDGELPHSSDVIMNHGRVSTFQDVDNVESGDFIFYNFGRLAAGHADDITMVVRPGLQIGARPSRNGVAVFDMAPERGWVLRYGRLG